MDNNKKLYKKPKLKTHGDLKSITKKGHGPSDAKQPAISGWRV